LCRALADVIALSDATPHTVAGHQHATGHGETCRAKGGSTEAKAIEAGTEQAHVARSLSRSGRVGDVGLRSGNHMHMLCNGMHVCGWKEDAYA
jgi:hypothetical protein